MPEVECQLPEIYLQPGEVYFALQPSIIHTILGSCVGVTFWSARFSVGALCHALLPTCPKKADAGYGSAEGYRFVDFAIRDLARRFDNIGAERKELQVKLFGGADVLPVGVGARLRPTVGKQNCSAAIEVLRDEGFQATTSSLGGTLGRRIQFHTGTGEVRLRWLSPAVVEESVDG